MISVYLRATATACPFTFCSLRADQITPNAEILRASPTETRTLQST